MNAPRALGSLRAEHVGSLLRPPGLYCQAHRPVNLGRPAALGEGVDRT